MNLFPSQYSTLSASALGTHIQDRYGLPDLHCRYILRGVSDTYLAEHPGGKYIFRVYRKLHRTLAEIKGEAELLTILKERGAAVSYPIPDWHGETVQAFNAAEGERYGVLFSFAQGSSVYDMNDQQLRTVGNGMAFVHNIASQVELNHSRPVYDLHSTVVRPLETLKPAFEEYQHPEGHAWLAGTAEKVIRRMEAFNTKAFSYGYCHYDFLPKNFHFDLHGNVTFFDFDFAGKGYLANDLMTLFVHFFLMTRDFGWPPERARERFGIFVEGYREVRPISDEELAAIPCLGFMFWTFFLGFQYENFDDWSNLFFGARFLKSRVALVKHWTDQYCEL